MLLLNYDSCLYEDSYLIAPNGEAKNVAISGAKYKELLTTNNTEVNPEVISEEWNRGTVLYADFNGVLSAGNVDYTVETVARVRIKSREEGSYQWNVLTEKIIENPEDFYINYNDITARAGKTMEYAVVPIDRENNSEGNYDTVKIKSDFDGLVLADRDNVYRAFIYDYPDISRNHITSTVTTLKSPYPFVIKNSQANYTSGSVSAGFLPFNKNEINLDYFEAPEFQEEFVDFLTNGSPKILKLDDGRSWIVSVVEQVSQASMEGLYYTNFQFVQIGDAMSNEDLYNADIVDATEKTGFYIVGSKKYKYIIDAGYSDTQEE